MPGLRVFAAPASYRGKFAITARQLTMMQGAALDFVKVCQMRVRPRAAAHFVMKLAQIALDVL